MTANWLRDCHCVCSVAYLAPASVQLFGHNMIVECNDIGHSRVSVRRFRLSGSTSVFGACKKRKRKRARVTTGPFGGLLLRLIGERRAELVDAVELGSFGQSRA